MSAEIPDRAGTTNISLGYSPTLDHEFLFYGMAEQQITVEGLAFTPRVYPMQTLDEMAQRGELDCTALSAAAYAHVQGRYALLPCGARFGSGYGPVVVTRNPLTPVDLHHLRIAVAGVQTSGFAALSLFLPVPFDHVVLPAAQIIEATARGDVDAGLVEDEWQLTHQMQGLYSVLDLGAWWQEQTGLDLPLDVMVVRSDLPPEQQALLCQAVRASLDYSLEHRDAALEYALKRVPTVDAQTADTYIGMYLGETTRNMDEAHQRSLRLFLDQCAQ